MCYSITRRLHEAIGHELVSGLHMLPFQSFLFQPILLLSGVAGHELVSGPSLDYKVKLQVFTYSQMA